MREGPNLSYGLAYACTLLLLSEQAPSVLIAFLVPKRKCLKYNHFKLN